MTYHVAVKIHPQDARARAQVDALLAAEGLRRDSNLEYTCGIFTDSGQLIATGSSFRNTLRCFAVEQAFQGEGLLNTVISHLCEYLCSCGHTDLFVYTKHDSMRYFLSLGFYEVASVGEKISFLENRQNGFRNFCQQLAQPQVEGEHIAAIVLNANPLTNGHLYLIEKALAENDHVHLFLVSEDEGPIPFAVRKDLLIRSVAGYADISLHDTGPYLISLATFPTYFFPDDIAAMADHAQLDAELFIRIANALHISRRYIGHEPHKAVMSEYNRILQETLPKRGIDCILVPRLTSNALPISASDVRQAIVDDDLDTLRRLTPDATFDYFTSAASKPVRDAIRASLE